MAALQNLHIVFQLQSLSPVVPNAHIAFNYETTFTTQDSTDIANLVSQIYGKFNAIPSGGTLAPCGYLSPVYSRAGSAFTCEVYDVTGNLGGARHGSPYYVTSGFIGSTASAGGASPEAAVVITLQAPYGTDVEFGPGTRPRARDRGRIYFGSVGPNAMGVEATTFRTIVTGNCQNDLGKFIKAINVLTTTPHTVVYNLAVWSRKNATMKSLQECWVDDAPDTQRRRGGTSATRTITPLP